MRFPVIFTISPPVRCFLGSVLVLCVPILCGCSATNSLTLQGQVSDLQNQRVALQNDRDAWKNRYEDVQASNRQQTHEIAASQQQIQLLKQEQMVLQKQLNDNIEQTANLQRERDVLSQQVTQYEDIRKQQEDGVSIPSNASMVASAPLPSIPGTVITSKGSSEIHIELPGSEIFEQNGALSTKGLDLIRRTANVVSSQYPGAAVEIQGHAGTFQKVGNNFRDAMAQTMSQAMMVHDVLTKENLLPPESMKVTGCGTTAPIISNASKGAQRNYRIELIVRTQGNP